MIVCEFTSPLDLIDKATHYQASPNREGGPPGEISEIIHRARCARCNKTAILGCANGINATFSSRHLDCIRPEDKDRIARGKDGPSVLMLPTTPGDEQLVPDGRGGWKWQPDDSADKNIYNIAKEIWQAGGTLKGGRIVIGTLPSPGRDPRHLRLRLDDNDTPGEVAVLDVASPQPLKELLPILTHGGIIEIAVDHVEQSRVRGRLKALALANQPPISDPAAVRSHRENIAHQPSLNALMSITRDRAGRVVWAHILCLTADGSKVDGAERQRRLEADGIPEEWSRLHGIANPEAAINPVDGKGEVPDGEEQLVPDGEGGWKWQKPPTAEALKPKKLGGSFTPLAEELLKVLSDPGQVFLLSTHERVPAAIRQVLGSQSRARKLLTEPFRRTAVRLREANKIIFDDEFSQLVQETANSEPQRLERLALTARPPFEQLWIEWRRKLQSSVDGVVRDDRWGILLEPRQGYSGHYQVMVAWKPGFLSKSKADQDWAEAAPPTVLLPGQLILALKDDAPEPVHSTLGIPGFADRPGQMLTLNYCERWTRQRSLLDRIASRGAYVLGDMPYGKLMTGLAKRAVEDEAIAAYFKRDVQLICGTYREILAGLALLATHIGGAPFTIESKGTTSTLFYRGKYHSPIEYKVIQLARPMPQSKLWRLLKKRAKHDGPLRWGTVIGAWHHRIEPNEFCDHHPRACPIALWEPIIEREPGFLPELTRGKDGSVYEEYHDDQRCKLCARKRWWVKDHARGDPEVGIVEKVYEITRSKRYRDRS